MSVATSFAGWSLATGGLFGGLSLCSSPHTHVPKFQIGECVSRSERIEAGLSPEYIHLIMAKSGENYVTCQSDPERDYWYGCDTDDIQLIDRIYLRVQCPELKFKDPKAEAIFRKGK